MHAWMEEGQNLSGAAEERIKAEGLAAAEKRPREVCGFRVERRAALPWGLRAHPPALDWVLDG